MKKILTFILALALAAGLVSCQKATNLKESAEVAAGRLDVTGRVSGGVTKTVFTCEAHVLTPEWKVGDRIIGLWGDDKSVTWKVRKIADGVAKFGLVSGEEPGDGEAVNVMYAPGKSASDVSGTGDARTLAFDLSNQSGILKDLGRVSLMTGSGTVSGETLELTFAHAIAVVSIDTLKGLAPNGSGYSVSIEGAGVASSGTFELSVGALAFTNGADGKISTGSTFTANAAGEIGPVFFAVPAANLGSLTVAVVKGADTLKAMLSGKAVNAGCYYYKGTLELSADVPEEEPLPGVFSVSATKKVKFAKGNLTYDISMGKWGSFEHQYELAYSYDAHLISLFCWGYNSVNSIRPDDTSETNSTVQEGSLLPSEDWGSALGAGWFTLNREEWTYLFDGGRMINGKPAKSWYYPEGVMIGGVNCKGMFVYPDNFDGAEIADWRPADWQDVEDAGVVFLPFAAYYRDGTSVAESIVGDEQGGYWTSTSKGAAGRAMAIGGEAFQYYDATRSYGHSVRLVKKVSN